MIISLRSLWMMIDGFITHYLGNTGQKKPDLTVRPVFADILFKSLFELELVLIDFVFAQILAPATKDKDIFRFFVLKILAAE